MGSLGRDTTHPPNTGDPGGLSGDGAWYALIARVGLSSQRREAIRRLRILENWIARNHRPTALFNADGNPRSDAVCLAVPMSKADKALEFRALCHELGIAGSLVQWRIEPGYR